MHEMEVSLIYLSYADDGKKVHQASSRLQEPTVSPCDPQAKKELPTKTENTTYTTTEIETKATMKEVDRMTTTEFQIFANILLKELQELVNNFGEVTNSIQDFYDILFILDENLSRRSQSYQIIWKLENF
jgi:glycyl-tRNA synthetase beta subunit